jgi:hypothetical protein
MANSSKSGEPPGQWARRGVGRLSLTGQVGPHVIQKPYMRNIVALYQVAVADG